MKTIKIYIALFFAFTLLNTEVAEAQTTEKKGVSKKAKGAVIGGVGGAVAGRVIAGKNGGTRGAIVGGIAGAAAGGAIGRKKDRKTDPVRYNQYADKNKD